MKIFLLSLLLLLAMVKNTVAQTYTIPWAQQQPAWVFPLWFENGDGQKDTLYIFYETSIIDYSTISDADSMWGIKPLCQDTSQFYVSTFLTFQGDLSNCSNGVKVYKVIGTGIATYFNNALFPIKIKWDKQKLYDTILPFPNILPNPIAKIGGTISCACTPFIGTAESFIQAEPGGSPCFNVGQFFTDSIVFDGPANANINDVLGISLSLRAQGSDCSYGAVNSIISKALISCSISSEKQIELKSNCLENLNFDIVDLYGRIIYRDKIFTKEVKHVDIHSNVNLLFVRVYNVNYYQTFKILIK